MVKATYENILSARLSKAGMRLERRGENLILFSGKHVLLAAGPNGEPLSLEQIDRETARFA